MLLDEIGLYGSLLHYAMIISLVGGAMLLFVYLWCTGRLGMDEEASQQMFEQDEHIHHKKD